MISKSACHLEIRISVSSLKPIRFGRGAARGGGARLAWLETTEASLVPSSAGGVCGSAVTVPLHAAPAIGCRARETSQLVRAMRRRAPPASVATPPQETELPLASPARQLLPKSNPLAPKPPSTGVSGRDRYAQLARFAGNVATPASTTRPRPSPAKNSPRPQKPVAGESGWPRSEGLVHDHSIRSQLA